MTRRHQVFVFALVVIAISLVINLAQGQWAYAALAFVLLVIGGVRLSLWRRP